MLVNKKKGISASNIDIATDEGMVCMDEIVENLLGSHWDKVLSGKIEIQVTMRIVENDSVIKFK